MNLVIEQHDFMSRLKCDDWIGVSWLPNGHWTASYWHIQLPVNEEMIPSTSTVDQAAMLSPITLPPPVKLRFRVV